MPSQERFDSGVNGRSRGQPPSVLVVGGGLAGIATAVYLAKVGISTTLVETRKRLGGRATSFVDPTTGQTLDNCQHVLLGCCTNLVDLYRRLGVVNQIRWHRRLYFAGESQGIDCLEADDLPAPLHMTRSLMGFGLLTWSEKIAISRGMLAILRLGDRGREAWQNRPFSQWLAEFHQPAGAVRKFWSVIVISALNELPDRVDASYAIQVFQEGFLAHEQGYVMGVPAVPLISLYDTAHRVIAESGGRVLLSTGANQFIFENGQIIGLELSHGQRLLADVFVSAVPHDRLSKLCTSRMLDADPRLRGLGRIGTSPIIGIHLWFETQADAPIMNLPHLILTQGKLQWIFNKGYDVQLGGQHLHGVISAAHDLVDKPADQIIEIAVQETRRALSQFPQGSECKMLHSVVVKEKRATFSISPGVDRFRPRTQGQIENLFLAGDWCQTGWPATMEGATRSGYLAGNAVAQKYYPQRALHPLQAVVSDLPRTACYQLFSRG